MRFQKGTQYFDRVIIFQDIDARDLYVDIRTQLSPPGAELSDQEIDAVFSTGIVHRDQHNADIFYRAV